MHKIMNDLIGQVNGVSDYGVGSRALAEENLLQLLTRPGNSLYQGALSLNAGVPGS